MIYIVSIVLVLILIVGWYVWEYEIPTHWYDRLEERLFPRRYAARMELRRQMRLEWDRFFHVVEIYKDAGDD